jgi:hypothetical protein
MSTILQLCKLEGTEIDFSLKRLSEFLGSPRATCTTFIYEEEVKKKVIWEGSYWSTLSIEYDIRLDQWSAVLHLFQKPNYTNNGTTYRVRVNNVDLDTLRQWLIANTESIIQNLK